MLNAKFGSPKNISGTTTVKAVGGQLIGFYVNSTSSGTVVLSDGATAMSGTITPAIGFHRFPATFQTSLVVTIANTLNLTVFIS
jgi:uridine phosphorylase